MTFPQSTYHSKLYRDFKGLDTSSYQTILRFYEDWETEIQQLEFSEFFELQNAYAQALFETGAYKKHLLMADTIIETAILRNIYVFHGEDIYSKMLFKKAASHYNLLEYEKAEYVLRELIKINPHNLDAIAFLKKCLRCQKPNYVKTTRAIAVFLFLITAIITCAELLFFRPFRPNYVTLVEQSRVVTFCLGWVILIGGDLLLRWRVEKTVNFLVEDIKMKKRLL